MCSQKVLSPGASAVQNFRLQEVAGTRCPACPVSVSVAATVGEHVHQSRPGEATGHHLRVRRCQEDAREHGEQLSTETAVRSVASITHRSVQSAAPRSPRRRDECLRARVLRP